MTANDSAVPATWADRRRRYARLRWDQGREAMRQGRHADARRDFARACRAMPGDAVYALNLAAACMSLEDLQGAEEAARRCTELDPMLAVGWLVRGDALRRMTRHADAVAAYDRAEQAGHEDADAYTHHGSQLLACGRPVEAIAKLLKASTIRPADPVVHGLLSTAFREMRLMNEAAECLRTVHAIVPGNLQALSGECFERRHVCDWRSLDAEVAEIAGRLRAADPDRPLPATSFAVLSLPIDPALQTKAALMDARVIAAQVRPLPPVDPATRRGRPLRVGYLSSDLRDHPVGQLMVEVLEQRPRGEMETVLYSHSPIDDSPVQRRLRQCADAWVDLNGTGDADAARRIRDDGIDVLVDLQGHTRGQRLAILARRPAPVQVAYLGFPGSTGAPFIDYLIGDPYVTPLALADLYTEKLAQLPLCFQPNGRWRPRPRAMDRADAGLPSDAFVMCAFNHTYKILPDAFDVWCGVMRDVPHAVLWLKETNGQLHDNVRREAAARGVDPSRVRFGPNVPYGDHFSRLALADVFVDTWPYNAHTTAADALWAGVPVVTVYGNGFASRVAASVLNAVDLPDLAFADPADYGLAIRALAADPALRAQLRAHLESERDRSPLFDAARRAGELESLYRRMAERWRAGLAPDHLPAEGDGPGRVAAGVTPAVDASPAGAQTSAAVAVA